MSKIKTVEQGGSLNFIFNRGGKSISGWICNITVKQYPDDPPLIARRIPAAKNEKRWIGYLTAEETYNLGESVNSPYYLTAILTNANNDEEIQTPIRFNVSPN